MTPSINGNVGISRGFGICYSGLGKPKTSETIDNQAENEGVKK